MHYVECLLLSYFFRFACFSVSARWNTIEMALKRKTRFSSKCLLLELFNWALSCSFERDGAIRTLVVRTQPNTTTLNGTLSLWPLWVVKIDVFGKFYSSIYYIHVSLCVFKHLLHLINKIIMNVLFTAAYRGYGIHWIICQLKSITVSDSWKFLFLYSQF